MPMSCITHNTSPVKCLKVRWVMPGPKGGLSHRNPSISQMPPLTCPMPMTQKNEYVNGAITVPSATTSKRLTNKSTIKIGANQNFFLIRIKSHRSISKSIINPYSKNVVVFTATIRKQYHNIHCVSILITLIALLFFIQFLT